MSCSLEITPNAVVGAPTKCELEIAEHRGQQVVEVVRYTTGHLTDDFHFLCLLESRLRLPTFRDLLSQLVIRCFKLGRSLADQIFQLRRRRLAVEQVVLYFVLTPSSAKRRANSAHQCNGIQGPLEQRNIAEALEQAQPVGMGSRRSGTTCKDDEGKV